MKKSKKLFIIPTLATIATVGASLTTTVSCSNNNNDIAIDKAEKEQRATEGGLAIYSFDFKGKTLPDSQRFVNIQLSELEIHTDTPSKSNAISVLQVVSKDEIVIHQDGHFDIPVKFINPEDLEATTTVKFQLKLRYRIAGVNHEVYINDLVIKYNTDGPKQKDEAQIKCLSDTVTTSTSTVSLPMKMIRDKDGYPAQYKDVLRVECNLSSIRAMQPEFKSGPSTVEFEQRIRFPLPKKDTVFKGTLIYTYRNQIKEKNVTVSVPFTFAYVQQVTTDSYIIPPKPIKTPDLEFKCKFTVFSKTIKFPNNATNIIIVDSKGTVLNKMYEWDSSSTIDSSGAFQISIKFVKEPASGEHTFYLKANVAGQQLITENLVTVIYAPL